MLNPDRDFLYTDLVILILHSLHFKQNLSTFSESFSMNTFWKCPDLQILHNTMPEITRNSIF